MDLLSKGVGKPRWTGGWAAAQVLQNGAVMLGEARHPEGHFSPATFSCAGAGLSQ